MKSIFGFEGSGLHFSNNELVRMLRFSMAATVVCVAISIMFGVGICSAAESGDIVVSDDVVKTYTMSPTYAVGANVLNLNAVYIDTANYNYLGSFHITLDPAQGAWFTNNFGSTSCEFSSGATGGTTYIHYDRNLSRVYYVFAVDMIVTSSPIMLSCNNPALGNEMGTTNYRGTSYEQAVSASVPVLIEGGYGYSVTGAYQSSVAARAVDHYTFTVLPSNYFSLSIDKNDYVSTKYFFMNVAGATYSQETTFNKIDINNSIFAQGDQVWINATLASGIYEKQLISPLSCVAGVCGESTPADIEGNVAVGGNGYGIQAFPSIINEDQNERIYWSRTANTGFGYLDYIMYGRPSSMGDWGDDDRYYEWDGYRFYTLVTSPAATGNTTIRSEQAGNYKVVYVSCLLGLCATNEVRATDTFTVAAETPSFVITNLSWTVGKYTPVSYRIGFTYFSNPTMTSYRYEQGAWARTDQIYLAGATGAITNISMVVGADGSYKIVLSDGAGIMKAFSTFTAGYGIIQPDFIIGSSNLSLDKSVYSYGESYILSYATDSYNYSRFGKRIEIYNAAHNATSLIFNPIAQIGDYSGEMKIDKIPFSGTNVFRLVAFNSTYSTVLASVSFALSNIDVEGYGLSYSVKSCEKNINTYSVQATAPVNSSLELIPATGAYTYFNFTGTKRVEWTPKAAGQAAVYLKTNGEIKRMVLLPAGNCSIAAAGVDGAAGTVSGVMSLIGSSMFVGLIIIMAVMAAGFTLAGALGGLGAVAVILPVLCFMGLLPLWIAFLEGVIVCLGIGLMLSGTLVKSG